MAFKDREDAGRRLASRLAELADAQGWADPIVLALPRGGVPVGAEVASVLGAPLDVLVARKIGAPGQPEYGIGAIAGDDPPLFDLRALRLLHVTPDELKEDVARERTELHRRERLYRKDRPALMLRDRTVILVDDGLATGVTAHAALRRIRAEHPAQVILAVPVCSTRAAEELRREADQVVCLQPHQYLHAVGVWYEDFAQVPDREVTAILERQQANH
ncbi:phosphoribosyltransferase [Streptomyces sp. NPDC003042]